MDAVRQRLGGVPITWGRGIQNTGGSHGGLALVREGAPPFIRRKELVLLGDTGQAQWQGAEGVLMVEGLFPVLDFSCTLATFD